MKILALEFSSSQRSVAVVQPMRGPTPSFESEILEPGGRSTKAFGMIERVLAKARIGRDEVECIAVGLGPGSYTGIRAAIALAQGWQLARPIRLLGIGTIEVLVAQAHGDGCRGKVWFAAVAQRGDCYLSGWDICEDGRFEREPFRIVSRAVVESHVADGQVVCGPDLGLAGVRPLHPSALTLGRLALDRSDFVDGNELRPVYLRDITFVKAPPPRVV
jgi:tRNA threonylcarbamoyl adenosine modification protein YeaZ